MQKTSVRAAARDARAQEKRATQALLTAPGQTFDSFTNFAQKMGVGADNATSTARYGFNPVTRNRIQLEWVHRGSWVGGIAIDIPADDMTRAGVDWNDSVDPNDQQCVEKCVTELGVWDAFGDAIRWGRLYGGAVAVMLIDGQDPRTPFDETKVGPDQFKGLLVLDRWMLEPDLSDLVTEYGPDLGKPRFYRVLENAPALRGKAIHYSRIALRHLGVELPYQQALTEGLWGLSIIERLWDRMTAFDSVSAGTAQLVYKAWLRTLKVKDLRSVVAAGGKPFEGLMKWVDVMRRYQNIEGITMLDAEDEMEVQEHGAFSGLADVGEMFAMQLSGALQIPLVRMLGQSPGGLGSNGDSELRTYYDGINQQQNRHMYRGVSTVYRVACRSMGIEPPEDFGLAFTSLWQLQPGEKSEIASKVTTAVTTAYEKGAISQQVATKELRQSARVTGVFSNISKEDIENADDELAIPGGDEAAGLEHDAEQADADRTHEKDLTEMQHRHEAEQAELDRKHQAAQTEGGQEHEAEQADMTRRHAAEQADAERKHKATLADKTLAAKKQEAKNARPNGKAGPVGGGARKRNRL